LRALTFERVDQARGTERPGKDVGAARRHGVAGQVRALRRLPRAGSARRRSRASVVPRRPATGRAGPACRCAARGQRASGCRPRPL
jgi:hypothetical protein